MSAPGLFGILQQIAEATDEQTAVLIAKEFGGYEISVPKFPKQNSRSKLVQFIGVDKAQAIADYVGAGNIKIPQAGFTGTTARRRLVAKMVSENKKVSEIIKETGYSDRQITRIKNTFSDPAPLSLFDDLD